MRTFLCPCCAALPPTRVLSSSFLTQQSISRWLRILEQFPLVLLQINPRSQPVLPSFPDEQHRQCRNKGWTERQHPTGPAQPWEPRGPMRRGDTVTVVAHTTVSVHSHTFSSIIKENLVIKIRGCAIRFSSSHFVFRQWYSCWECAGWRE